MLYISKKKKNNQPTNEKALRIEYYIQLILRKYYLKGS